MIPLRALALACRDVALPIAFVFACAYGWTAFVWWWTG